MTPSRGLESVLNLHRLRRRVLKQLLAALAAQRQDLVASLRALDAERGEVLRWNRAALAQAGPVEGQSLTEGWLLAAAKREAALKARVAELEAQSEDASKRLVAASQDLKMLARLTERRRLRELRESERREQKEMDAWSGYAQVTL